MDPPTGSGPRRLFAGKSQRKMVAAAGGDDLISALPDSLIHRVMSFLEAPEAVRTCVLSQRWRHLWKSMPVLRLTRAAELHNFLDHLLLLRDRSPLDACFFRFSVQPGDDTPLVDLWARHALRCQVRALSVAVNEYLPFYELPAVSENLTKLELEKLILYDKFLDFSSCRALKDLKLYDCAIETDKIYSPSLTCLSILECEFLMEGRTCISAPSLISLRLDGIVGRTPLFEDMPVLATAVVILNSYCGDSCENDDPGYCGDASCRYCYGTDDGSGGCVLLRVYSQKGFEILPYI